MGKKLHTWDVCVVADKIRWLGRVEAQDEKGAKRFLKDPKTLIVVRKP
jgi:hypothetical protein